jgi:hypothetical protein
MNTNEKAIEDFITMEKEHLLQKGEEILRYEIENYNRLLFIAEASRIIINESSKTKELVQTQTKRIEQIDNNLQNFFDNQLKLEHMEKLNQKIIIINENLQKQSMNLEERNKQLFMLCSKQRYPEEFEKLINDRRQETMVKRKRISKNIR